MWAQFHAEEEHLRHVYAQAVAELFATGYQVTDAEYRKLKLAVENALIDVEALQMRGQGTLQA